MTGYQFLMAAAARSGRLRDLHESCTCPHCRMHWQPSADSERAVERDFAGTVHCPDCYLPSRSNPHLNTPMLWDGRRLPLAVKERGAR